MTQYIDKDALVAEIERQQRRLDILGQSNEVELRKDVAIQNGVYCSLLSFLDTLEVKEVDLKKLGEIARHLIAVKENIEDMRLDSSEWILLRRIGYQERLNARKEE